MAKGRKQSRQRPAGRRPGGSPIDRQRDTVAGRATLGALLVLASAIVVYLNAFGNDFVLDDIALIRDNVRIRSLANVPHLFASSYWGYGGAQALYRPLVLVTYALNYAVHGLSTIGYTAVNVSLHAAVSLLVFELVRRIGGSLFAAVLAGVAFAVHPVHTEAVTGISGRPELLAAFFVLLAMIFHRRAAGRTGASVGYRLGMLTCFACALLSKESAITLVLALPLMDALVPSKGRDGRAGSAALSNRHRLPAAHRVATLYLVLRRAVLGGVVIAGSAIAPLDNPLVPISTMPLGERLGATTGQALMTPFAVVLEYARLLVWPARLSPDYSYNQIPLVTSALDVRFLSGAALIAVCVYGIVVLWRRSPVAAFGLAFAALTFSIVSNFVITIGTICAERLMYLPSAGLLIAAAVGVERLAPHGSSRRRIAYAALMVALVAGGARTWIAQSRLEDRLHPVVVCADRGSRQRPCAIRVRPVDDGTARKMPRVRGARQMPSSSTRPHKRTSRPPSRFIRRYSLPIDSLAMIFSLHERFDEAMVQYARALKAWPGNYASLTNWGFRTPGTRDPAEGESVRTAGRRQGHGSG